jgi:hypothetical protein
VEAGLEDEFFVSLLAGEMSLDFLVESLLDQGV